MVALAGSMPVPTCLPAGPARPQMLCRFLALGLQVFVPISALCCAVCESATPAAVASASAAAAAQSLRLPRPDDPPPPSTPWPAHLLLLLLARSGTADQDRYRC